MTSTQPSGAATPSSPSPIGVALLGFGFAGRTFHAPFIDTTAGLALRVVGSRQAALVHEAYPAARCIADPHEAIAQPDVDLVVIATPNDSHAPLAEAALRAGRHVVVDKPFTVTLDEARHLTAVAAECDRRLSVFQNRRWDSDFLGVAQAVREGRIGEVVELRSEIGRWRPQVRDRWRERPGPGAGIWYDLGPHLVDQAVTLFGPPATIDATLRAQRPGGETVDWFHVVLDYPSRQVIVTSSMLAAEAPPRFIVRGTTGAMVKRGTDVQERRLMAGERPVDDEWGHDPDPLRVMREGEPDVELPVPRGHYGQYYAAMRDAIAGVSAVPVTPQEALLVMTIIETGIQSSAARCTLEVQAVEPSR